MIKKAQGLLFFLTLFVLYYCTILLLKLDVHDALSGSSYTAVANWKYKNTVNLVTKSAERGVAVIAILSDGNFKSLGSCLSSIDKYLLDNNKSHILVFHSGYPYQSDISNAARCTRRQIIFRNVEQEFASFTQGFNPYLIDPTWSKRGKWNYHQMIRFWFKTIFEIAEVQQYDYIMRLDTDSKLLDDWIDVFSIMRKRNAVYFANNQDIERENVLPGTLKLKEFVFDYKRKMNITVKNMKKFNDAFLDVGIKTYYNNFEIMKTNFFRQAEVHHWINAIDASHGIYKYRWGDAILRYLTLLFFAEPNQILHRELFNLSYCHPC